MQKTKETMTGLMLGDTPIYFDLGGPRSSGVMVNPNRMADAVNFLARATGRTPMIKVIITGPPKNGYFPYKVDWWFQGRPQLTGLSPVPLLDACRQLQQVGLMDSTVVGLFDEDEETWKFRTTVGYGARAMQIPGGLPSDDMADRAFEAALEATGPPPATPVEEPPEPRTPPRHPAGKGQGHAEPDKPEPPHRKRKRAGSGARRGSR